MAVCMFLLYLPFRKGLKTTVSIPASFSVPHLYLPQKNAPVFNLTKMPISGINKLWQNTFFVHKLPNASIFKMPLYKMPLYLKCLYIWNVDLIRLTILILSIWYASFYEAKRRLFINIIIRFSAFLHCDFISESFQNSSYICYSIFLSLYYCS